MQIYNAQFVTSSPSYNLCPDSNLPEYAFIGRSNVGKSSLINMLTGNNNLAHTGATPGKTVMINHFLINEKWYLVDLPGYGYAQRGKQQRQAFRKLIEEYTIHRKQLFCLFILIDARLSPQKIDLDFIHKMGEEEVPLAFIFTKTDKLSQKKLQENIAVYKEKLLESWEELPPIFIASSVKGIGKMELLSFIEKTNSSL